MALRMRRVALAIDCNLKVHWQVDALSPPAKVADYDTSPAHDRSVLQLFRTCTPYFNRTQPPDTAG